MYYFCSTIQGRIIMDYTINIKNHSKVVVGNLSELLPTLLPQKRVIVISDTNIDRFYHPILADYDHILIGLGETSKTIHTLENIFRQLIELGADRETFLLGIGGGIVTDITGFVASTYMRGIDFGFISTTLLGQVDASVGGKNGINMDGYKNMIGAFNQPRFVICDVNMLSTLSAREFRTGLAEAIKAGIIADAELFERLEETDLKALQHNPEQLREVVFKAIKVKAEIVERDERESGDRRKLNLGHTMAHAIEKCSSKCNHGEAVAIGIALIAKAATKQGILSEETLKRIVQLLERAGFPLEPPVELRHLLKEVSKDKKSAGKDIHIIFPTSIGECQVQKMSLEEFKAMIKS